MARALRFRGTLMPHQKTAVKWLTRRPKAVLADDVGLGKTATAIGLVAELFEAGELPHRGRPLCRVLWITDASLVDQTASEAGLLLGKTTILAGDDPELGTGQKAQQLRSQNYPSGVDIMILSHELAQSRRHWLDSFQPSMLVIDEASKLKGRQAMFETLRDLARRTPRVLSMTATPLENDPTELWSILSATDTPWLWSERVFEDEFVTWREGHDRFGRSTKRPEGWIPGAPEVVRAYLSKVLLRRTAVDVGLPLPTRIDNGPLWVTLPTRQLAAYEKATSGLQGFHQQQKAGLLAGGSSALVDALVRELKARGEEQAIVYSETLQMLDLIQARLTELDISNVRVEGENTDHERTQAVTDFRNGDVRVLLGSRVLERGLNLQHCRLLISLDSSWNPKREHQREGRICRIGSPHASYEHMTLLPDTPLVRSKQATLERKTRSAELVGL
jgi:SNF2 family DNA or RNA helicase